MDVEKQLEIIKRNTVDLINEEELKERLKEKSKLRIKLGVDPSRPDLHLGHAVVLKKLREFQDLGHQVVLIIGDFTARIGDPSGRSKTRPMLTLEEVKKNAESYQKQAFKILDKEKTEVRYNGEWFDKMTFHDVVKLSSHYTVARMLERDDFAKRLANNEPISVSEFLYPLAQAYDSVMVESDIEIGGTDQLFNLLVGRKIQEAYGQKSQIVLTMPIIEGTDGHLKMSKSYDNYIAFEDEPFDMYGKVMSIPDTLILKYMRLATDVPENEIKEYEKQMKENSVNPRDIKMKLAYEIVKFFHGKEKAEYAQNEFVKVFQKKDIPDEMEELTVEKEITAIDLLMKTNSISSKSEAKRLIKQGGVRINKTKINDPFQLLEIKDNDILRIGKRRFFNLKTK
ncbi:tyrosine--tRNA ligase [Marinitoga sp. 1135]|uniref:Tyrosine--tRNA ligase n=1 Tax=Marinitoga piezophila (strain DSM 14283 / JCM 11233 / KA3) TaxID=443254 RepID=H2J5H4_MARPK|nr:MULTISPECIES: tyrosine--tRNA ligase [Marinitoga]AEX86118.1 tyrosyl-tRNA synthetase [Marinitoga piezophila KA3]APT76534.1 tyrosine--tRNA ligase [Marinitoga sp. 1137]NUU96303.1 tyrosine--tRNA ligase [Marinitoga sp. 1135]NUU98221.1 tyrosine--tRNA ligase [Marinitoga sp. 1138]